MKAVTFSSSLVVIITSINAHIALQEHITPHTDYDDVSDFTSLTAPEKTTVQLNFYDYMSSRGTIGCSTVNDWNSIGTVAGKSLFDYSSSASFEYCAR